MQLGERPPEFSFRDELTAVPLAEDVLHPRALGPHLVVYLLLDRRLLLALVQLDVAILHLTTPRAVTVEGPARIAHVAQVGEACAADAGPLAFGKRLVRGRQLRLQHPTALDDVIRGAARQLPKP